uniref:Uncharacterized protein n=1 Tax=Lepeophtheirus salmonis TaxID=72036 RepID=A0A0K2TI54_LEPSM
MTLEKNCSIGARAFGFKMTDIQNDDFDLLLKYFWNAGTLTGWRVTVFDGTEKIIRRSLPTPKHISCSMTILNLVNFKE